MHLANARGNQISFLTKKLSKEIMTKSRLRSNYLKNRNEENKTLYIKQKIFCFSASKIQKKKILRKLR